MKSALSNFTDTIFFWYFPDLLSCLIFAWQLLNSMTCYRFSSQVVRLLIPLLRATEIVNCLFMLLTIILHAHMLVRYHIPVYRNKRQIQPLPYTRPTYLQYVWIWAQQFAIITQTLYVAASDIPVIWLEIYQQPSTSIFFHIQNSSLIQVPLNFPEGCQKGHVLLTALS